ncbi:uncharacterized protein LOC144617700 isoform X1 [Crassostrea virginica]
MTIECRDEYDGQQNCSKHIFPTTPGTPCQVHDCSNSSCHFLSGCSNNASKKEEKEENNKKQHIVSKYIKISIITFGILTLTTLILFITRFIYKLCRISAPRGNGQNPSDTPDVDDIYNEITEI